MAFALPIVLSGSMDAPFVDLDFDAARAIAARDGKDVLVFFSEPDNGQCRIYVDATWGDGRVRSWLDGHAVAIELELSAHQDLAKRFGVVAAPTVMLLDASGVVKARVAGFRMPTSLIRSLDSALAGPATQSKPSPSMPMVKEGESFQKQGRYVEAMERYLACMNAEEETPGVLPAKTEAVKAMGRLALVHPPALRALKDRRDEVHRRIIAREAKPSDAAVFLALTRALRTIAAPTDGASSDVLRARALAKAGRRADALSAFLRILDADDERPGATLGPKLLVIADIGSLGRDHPPALAALRVRGDRIRQRLLGLEAKRTDPALLVAISDQLGEVDECLDLCHRLDESDPRGILTRLLRERTAHSLVAVGRYDDAAGLIDALAAIKVARAQHEKDLTQAVPSGQSPDTVHRFLREKFLSGAVPLYELLIGARRTTQADEAAGVILGVSGDADTHAALAAAGLRTMRPVDANIEQARRALELAPSGDVEKIELLVLILQTMQRSDEAKQVVARHIDRVSDSEAKRSLMRLVALTP